MKIGILTFHRANNYGAMLQAYALQETLQDFGLKVEFIDYRCDSIEKHYKHYTFPKFKSNITWCKQVVKYFLIGSKIISKENNYSNFRKLLHISNVNVTQCKAQLEDYYDAIITGSDQVWSYDVLNELNDWYCYKKINLDTRLISYAASAGSLKTFDRYFYFYGDIIKGYSFISVRESNLMDYLIKKGFNNTKNVVDPTLLLNREKWNRLDSAPRIIKKKYVLYYDVENNDEAKNIAIELSNKQNMKLVVLNGNRKISNNCISYIQAGPIEFLNLIRNAEYVVGSSFHLTVFSIIFEKKFVNILHPKTGDRVRELLCSLGLLDRIVDISNYDRIYNDINYGSVSTKIEHLRSFSLNFIRKSIFE